jgi:hypothetical protein
VGPRLEELTKRRPDIAVREIDINRATVQGIDFDSPVARQYGVNSAPYFIIVGPDGRIISAGSRARGEVIQCFRVEELG